MCSLTLHAPSAPVPAASCQAVLTCSPVSERDLSAVGSSFSPQEEGRAAWPSGGPCQKIRTQFFLLL